MAPPEQQVADTRPARQPRDRCLDCFHGRNARRAFGNLQPRLQAASARAGFYATSLDKLRPTAVLASPRHHAHPARRPRRGLFNSRLRDRRWLNGDSFDPLPHLPIDSHDSGLSSHRCPSCARRHPCSNAPPMIAFPSLRALLRRISYPAYQCDNNSEVF